MGGPMSSLIQPPDSEQKLGTLDILFIQKVCFINAQLKNQAAKKNLLAQQEDILECKVTYIKVDWDLNKVSYYLSVLNSQFLHIAHKASSHHSIFAKQKVWKTQLHTTTSQPKRSIVYENDKNVSYGIIYFSVVACIKMG